MNEQVNQTSISTSDKVGKDSLYMPYKASEHNRKNDALQYCNFIPPAPRDPLVNVPYLGKSCPYDAHAKNAPEGCYLVKSKDQNTVGFVCKDPNGNADHVRGNTFGVNPDIDVDGLSKSKKAEYTIENPVQLPTQLRNPLVKYDKSTFYPTYLQSFNSLGEYPHAANYDNENIAKGVPTYVYPYKVINPRASEPDVISLSDGFVNEKGVDRSSERGEIVEYVENFENSKSKSKMVMIIFAILVLIILLMLIFCGKIEIGCLLKKIMK